MGDFKTVFKELRIARGLTQAELAKRLSISRSTVGMYESGERVPRHEDLEAIADFFNVDIDYLLGRTYKTTVLPQSYYMYEDIHDIADFLNHNPEYRSLFDAAMRLDKKDINFIKELIERCTKND